MRLTKWLRACALMAIPLALMSCGGGGGSASGCASTSVYDSYGYSGNPNAEIDVPLTLSLSAHVTTGCLLSNELSGALPTGLAFNAATGTISGTPTQIGLFPLIVRPQAAGNTVMANITIRIDPVGPQTPALRATRLSASPNLPILSGLSLASVDHGSGRTVYASGVAPGFNYEIWSSSDAGGTWARNTSAGVPAIRGSTQLPGQFRLFAGNGLLYVLDTGGTPSVQPVLYRFDGTAWATVAAPLPFSITGQGEATTGHVLDDGSLLVTWVDAAAAQVWSSVDGVLWNRESAPEFNIPFVGSRALCLGSSGTDLRAVALMSGSTQLARRSLSQPSWTSNAWANSVSWPSSVITPGALCASAQNKFWLFGTGSDATSGTYITVSAVGLGEAEMEYPRRIRAISGLDAITNLGSGFIGLRLASSAYEVWVLQ